jgi:hypothetical protein
MMLRVLCLLLALGVVCMTSTGCETNSEPTMMQTPPNLDPLTGNPQDPGGRPGNIAPN